MLSDRTHQLVQRLFHFQNQHPWFGARRRKEQIVAVLTQVADQGEPQAVSYVLQFLFFKSPGVRVAACRTIHRLLTSVPPDKLLQLYDVIHGWYTPSAWNGLAPSRVETLVADESCRSSVLGLASLHRNGYVRQAAVRLLAEVRDGSELPYLLIRLNDWVMPVRADALIAVGDRLDENYLRHFVSSLPLMSHLLILDRYDHTPVVNRLVEILVQPQHDTVLAGILQSPHRKVRRMIVRIALRLCGEHRRRIVEHGLNSDDGVLRLWCTRETAATFSDDELKGVLDRIKRDRFMPVRREAIRLKAEMLPDSERDVWTDALLDSNISIRELAQFKLRAGGFDLAQFYRDTLADHPNSLAAIGGLGETGDASDLCIVRPHLKASLPSHRRPAVRAFGRLGGESDMDELVDCLRDDSPSVVRVARRQLREHLLSVDGSQLFAVVKDDHRLHVRIAALQLMFEESKWQSLPWLIRAVAHQDQRTAEYARNLIEAWFSPPRCNKVFTRPSPSERKALEVAVQQSAAAIEESFIEKLRDWTTQGM